MRESEKPVSFIVRPWMQRGTPAEDDARATKETFRVEPLGIVPPRAKTPPPPREYLVKGRKVDIHPDAKITVFSDGARFMSVHGRPMVALPPEKDEKRTPFPAATYRPFLMPMGKAVPGTVRTTRGRQVPKVGTAEATGRKHPCPLAECGKTFHKRSHLRRHVLTLHQPKETGS